MTINHNDVKNLSEVTWKILRAATFNFTPPFTLHLEDGQLFKAEKIARLLPGKRMVVFGEWQGKSVVAKLFFDPKQARHHIEKELAGIKTLQESRIPTPALYYQGMSKDEHVQVLIFEKIEEADELENVWRHRINNEILLPILKSVIVEIATQHVFGIVQHDLHLNNFLVTEKVIYTLDGGQIETLGYLLPKKESLNSLALFLSQLGMGVEKIQEKLFRHYMKSRGWQLKKNDMVDIFHHIRRWQVLRWKKYKKKIFRESSRFRRLKSWFKSGMLDRQLVSSTLMQLLEKPDSLFQLPGTIMLKAGRSSTVAKIHIDGRDFVIKRYNMKSTWHRLRRCLRLTRSAKSWRLAHKMNLFGIATAIPMAYIESRFLGLRGNSYLIMDYIEGEDIASYFTKQYTNPQAVTMMVANVVRLLQGMRNLGLSHGDLKSTNIIINSKNQPVFIDLDGAVEHASIAGLQKAWVKEIKRFLRNFDDMPIVREQFKVQLKG